MRTWLSALLLLSRPLSTLPTMYTIHASWPSSTASCCCCCDENELMAAACALSELFWRVQCNSVSREDTATITRSTTSETNQPSKPSD